MGFSLLVAQQAVGKGQKIGAKQPVSERMSFRLHLESGFGGESVLRQESNFPRFFDRTSRPATGGLCCLWASRSPQKS